MKKFFLNKRAPDVFLRTILVISGILCVFSIYSLFISGNNFFDRTKRKLDILEQRIEAVEKKLKNSNLP